VLVDPGNVNEVYAGTNTGVYHSTNAGSSWTQINTGLYNITVTSLGIYPNNYLYAGTDGGGMYRWNIMVGVKEHKTDIVNPRLMVQPNPAHARVQFNYILNVSGLVKLAVYNAIGRKVKNIINADQAPGEYLFEWNCRDDVGHQVTPGIYFCRLETKGMVSIQKLVIVK
jgi:hypothetical protein